LRFTAIILDLNVLDYKFRQLLLKIPVCAQYQSRKSKESFASVDSNWREGDHSTKNNAMQLQIVAKGCTQYGKLFKSGVHHLVTACFFPFPTFLDLNCGHP
jgi:hypothetical protein